MADKQGLRGAQAEPSDAESLGPGRDEREAYEEDWYRSLRAFAERQQHLADQDEELDEQEPAEAVGAVEGSADGQHVEPAADSYGGADTPWMDARDAAVAGADEAAVTDVETTEPHEQTGLESDAASWTEALEGPSTAPRESWEPGVPRSAQPVEELSELGADREPEPPADESVEAEDALMGLLRDPIPAVAAAAQEALTRITAR